MQQLQFLLSSFFEHVRNVLMSPFDPGNRIFYVCLCSSVLIAFWIYVRNRKNTSEVLGEKSFVGFLFPKKVWRHPSAWLDVRYFFFHMFIGHFFMIGLSAAAAALSYQWASGGFSSNEVAPVQSLEGWTSVGITVAYMAVLFLVVDFLGFLAHFLQHKIPLLWQFHKVHHSAEVMHPISNFREHPVDNLFYIILIGLGGGAITGFTFRILGYHPNLPVILGVPVFMFLFNFAGYNLRHSHIWLRWPSVWSKVFPSPAHHHVHHSCHPDHLDKNFAFMFPFWDVVFGTYVMPENNRDVKFGVTEKDNGLRLDTCLKLYVLPFQDAWRLFRPKKPSAQSNSVTNEPAE